MKNETDPFTLGWVAFEAGIAQANNAIHSPNEHFVIDNYHRSIEAVIRLICGLAEGR